MAKHRVIIVIAYFYIMTAVEGMEEEGWILCKHLRFSLTVTLSLCKDTVRQSQMLPCVIFRPEICPTALCFLNIQQESF